MKKAHCGGMYEVIHRLRCANCGHEWFYDMPRVYKCVACGNCMVKSLEEQVDDDRKGKFD